MQIKDEDLVAKWTPVLRKCKDIDKCCWFNFAAECERAIHGSEVHDFDANIVSNFTMYIFPILRAKYSRHYFNDGGGI